MGITLFLVVVVALAIVTIPILKKDKYFWWTIGAILISGWVVMINGTYQACKDGWKSHSIGTQGACSWHGGVVTELNNFGWVALIISITIIAGVYVYIEFIAKSEDEK